MYAESEASTPPGIWDPDHRPESDAREQRGGGQEFHPSGMPGFVLCVYMCSWDLFDLTKQGAVTLDLDHDWGLFEESAILIGSGVYEHVVPGPHFIPRAAQLMDHDVTVRIVIGDIGFAMDIQAYRRIDLLLQPFHGFLITCQPVICFISPEGHTSASDK